MNGPPGPVLFTLVGGVHRGRLPAEGCLETGLIGELTVTGEEKRDRFVGLITPDMAVTELRLG